MVDQDDDLLQDYDKDASAGAIDAEQEAKIMAFQKKVKGLERIILKPQQNSVEKRRDAVRMLGELGEVESIPSLVKVYQRDKSPGMKEAAAQALGMFKALEDAYFDDDPERQAYAQTLIEGIVFHETLGQRSRLKRRPLQILSGILFLSFAALSALGLMAFSQKPAATNAPLETAVPTIEGVTFTPIPTPVDVPGIAALLQTDYAILSGNASALRTEMLNSTREQPQTCEATRAKLKRTVPIVLPTGTQADLVNVTDALNKARSDMAPIVTAYETACSTAKPIPRAEANTYDGTLVAIQTTLVKLPAQLSTFGVTPNAVAAATATPVMTNTPTSTPTPTATLDPQKYSKHIIGMRQIVSTMTSSGGSNTLLRQYWDDVIKSGSTGGCRNLPAPVLPQDYVIDQALLDAAPKDLITALNDINTGLTLSRQSWQAFEKFCADSSLSAIAPTQYTAADTAKTAFEEASDLLLSADAEIKGIKKP